MCVCHPHSNWVLENQQKQEIFTAKNRHFNGQQQREDGKYIEKEGSRERLENISIKNEDETCLSCAASECPIRAHW